MLKDSAVHQFWWLNLESSVKSWIAGDKKFQQKRHLCIGGREADLEFHTHLPTEASALENVQIENDFLHKLSFCAKDLIGFSHLIFLSLLQKCVCELFNSDSGNFDPVFILIFAADQLFRK